MKRFLNIKDIRLYLWVALAFLGLWMFHSARFPDTFIERVINNVWRILYLLVVSYSLFEFSFPFIVRKRRLIVSNILLAIPIIFAYMMLYSFGLYAWRLIGMGLHIYTRLVDYKSLEIVSGQMSFSMSFVFFLGIVRHAYHYTKLKQATQQLRIQKQEAELSYLRSQTNPHFLFNTLNNIYSLARDKSDLAPESILRLSKILRFMLYETAVPFISIERELKVITDYIELEKLRYDESLRINFSHDIEDMKQGVPPLLLIPLVENAFKHGVSETRDQPFLDVHVSIKQRQLVLVVRNSTEPVTEEKNIKENIGLSNLRRQLELLYKDYNLSVQQKESEFIATLKINLASHV